MEHAWRTALSRWGDELWSLALLRAGNRAGAQQVMVRAFERVYTAKTPPTDAYTALAQALMPPRRRWLPRIARQRALPPKLRRVGPTERMLLLLWLVRGRNGAELARVTQLPTTAIQDQLARALLRFVPRRNIARRSPDGRGAWEQWLGLQLQLRSEPLPDTVSPTTLAVWQAALNRVRDLLTLAVDRQRLPGTVRDAIETALVAREDEIPAWQRKIGLVALAALLAAVGWIFLRPTAQAPAAQTTASASASPQTVDAQTLAQNALDAWTTMPISGTLHRRVWAVDERPTAHDQVHITDVWLANDTPQYRVETTRDGKLLEWHVVDNKAQLHTASDAQFNMCQWSYGSNVGSARAHTFTVPPDQVRAIRNERLRSGSYGEGYRMLHRALQAPDLRSYGVRNEADRVLVTLGFRDEETTPARTVLLLLDGRTHELQTVRELVGDAAQTSAHDVWRLEAQETLPAVPAALPNQDIQAVTSSDVIDPSCPGLAREAVVSLRRLAMIPYSSLPVPTPLPADVVQAAVVSSAPLQGLGYDVYTSVQVVLRSADGWLRIRPGQGYVESSPATDLIERGQWVVQFKDAAATGASVVATVSPKMDERSTWYYGQPIEIVATGWTRDQVLDVVDRLQLLNERTWPALASQFLDPRPLPADVEQVLIGAQQALAALPDGTTHVTMDVTTRTDPQPFERADPYHVPTSITTPNAWTVEQWATISDTAPVQFKQVATAPDGTLLSAQYRAPAQSAVYDATVQQSIQFPGDEFGPYFYGEEALGADLARSLLAWDAPITITMDGDLWRFEQALSEIAVAQMTNEFWFRLLRTPTVGSGGVVYGLSPLPGTYVQRIAFDREQLLPRRWEAVLRAPNGAETVLHTITVREWRVLDAALPESFWTLPTLPNDTLVSTTDTSSLPLPGSVVTVPPPNVIPTTLNTAGGPIPTTPPERALAWPAESGLIIGKDEPYRSSPTIESSYFGGSLLDTLLYGGASSGVRGTGLVRFTNYKVPDSSRLITVTQGPRALLRSMLRRTNGGFSTFVGMSYGGYAEAPQQSDQIQVTIANEQYDAWLLRAGTDQTALVVEIDDMLLHIAGPANYMSGVLREQLPALQWEPVVLGQSGDGGAREVQP